MNKSKGKLEVAGTLLLRAPLLPWAGAIGRADAAAARAAVALAAPGLPTGEAGEQARRRYLARMAFRPVPAGLLAGVAVGRLGARTAIATGHATDGARAHLAPGWARMAALGRTLLDEPEGRMQARVRQAPSLLVDGDRATWLRMGDGAEAEVVRAEIDPLLEAVLAATASWAPWAEARAVVETLLGDDDAADDLLLQLLDGGLLHADVVPPLVGPPPARWLAERAARLEPPPRWLTELQRIAEASGPLEETTVRDLQRRLARLPGAPSPGLEAVLELAPRQAVIARRAVERAAAIAPLLFRMQRALGGPIAERAMSPRWDELLRTLVERHEPGAFDLASLEHGRFGIAIADPEPLDLPSLPADDGDAEWASLPAPLLRLLVSRMAEDPSAIALTAAEIDAALPSVAEADAAPPTFELVVAPCREPPRAPPGTGWLLGLHGPAGSTWGRFAWALGAPLERGFAEIDRLESARLGDGLRCDVVYGAGRAVAQVGAHPPLRRAAIALSSWPEGCEAIRPAEIALTAGAGAVSGGVAEAPSAIGLARGDRAVVPLPCARLRSTTVDEEGAHQLLVGFGLTRAVAPWALHLGPFAALPRTPRVTVEGFVVTPASWEIPPAVVAACATGRGARAVAAWRRALAVPDEVQIGLEDRLFAVALGSSDGRSALAELAAEEAPWPRAWEIWPPRERLADRDGRRVEAVVAVVGTAPPLLPRAPVAAEEAAGWITLALYGAPDRADRVLREAVAPALHAARAAGAVEGWFFQRYRDGERHHLRLRVRPTPRGGRLVSSLRAALAPAIAAGDLASIEQRGYHRERGRFGDDAEAVERIFEADSSLCLALLALSDEEGPPIADLVVRGFDALARGLGLDAHAAAIAARSTVAQRLRPDPARPDELAPWYRERQRALLAGLAADQRGEDDAIARAHGEFTRAVAAAAVAPGRAAALLPSLLHLAAVRRLGPRSDGEVAALYLWERARASLAARARRP